METELFAPFDMKEIYGRYGLSGGGRICTRIGCDDRIYMLFRTDGGLSLLILSVDWDSGGMISHEYFPLGVHGMDYPIVQPFPGGEKLLLLETRCCYDRAGGAENNALIVDLRGNVLSEQCFGDGIQDCIITGSGDIVTSFFDEGIFGNLGWDDPIGKRGLIVRSADGRIKWEAPAERDICDCYAVNIDDYGHLWYYYYIDLKLVRTDFSAETEYDPQIKGADGFLISSDARRFIFSGGYERRGSYSYTELKGSELTHPQPMHFMYGGAEPLLALSAERGPRAVFSDSKGQLFTYIFR